MVNPARTRSRNAFTLLEMVIAIAVLGIVTAALVVSSNALLSRSSQTATAANLDMVYTAQARHAAMFGSYTPAPADLKDCGPVTSGEPGPEFGGDICQYGTEFQVTSGYAGALDVVSIAVSVNGSLSVATIDEDDNCLARRYEPYGESNIPIAVEVPETAPCEAKSALPAGEAPAPSANTGDPFGLWD